MYRFTSVSVEQRLYIFHVAPQKGDTWCEVGLSRGPEIGMLALQVTCTTYPVTLWRVAIEEIVNLPVPMWGNSKTASMFFVLRVVPTLVFCRNVIRIQEIYLLLLYNFAIKSYSHSKSVHSFWNALYIL